MSSWIISEEYKVDENVPQTVFKNGTPVHIRAQCWTLLVELIKAKKHNRVLTYNAIAYAIWDEKWDYDRKESLKIILRDLRRVIGSETIKSVKKAGYYLDCDLTEITEEPIEREEDGANNCKIGTETRKASDLSIVTLTEDELFIEPYNYIYPETWINQLKKDAFKNRQRVHVISGERGIGKTELARCYAKECYECGTFKNVVCTSYISQGLAQTIEYLPCTGMEESINTYDLKRDLLNKLDGSTLIIIDNYDSIENINQELSVNSKVLKDLKDAGCYTLITSRVELHNYTKINNTTIKPLNTDALVDLFFSVADYQSDDDEGYARELIEKYLNNNTYLVRLAAKLTRTKDIKEVIHAFKSHSVSSIDDPIKGKNLNSASMMEQYKLLFDLSEVARDTKKCELLYCMALLPAEGMLYEDFFNSSFNREEKSEYKIAFAQLEDSFWTVLQSKKVMLHPMIREMILEKPFVFHESMLSCYLAYLIPALQLDSYKDNLEELIRRGIGAAEALEKLEISGFNAGLLFAALSSICDLVDYDNNNEIYESRESLVYKYAKKAIIILKEVSDSVNDDDEVFKLAWAFNNAGYAILHDKRSNDSIKYAEESLRCSKNNINKISNKQDISVRKLYTCNQGDIAALYLMKEDYDRALKIHSENKAIREDLLKEEDSKYTKRLLAASYKGIATAEYYIAKNDHIHKVEHLRKSVSNHLKAIHCYEEAHYPKYDLEIAIAVNRYSGSVLALLQYLDTENRSNYAKEAIAMLKDAINYLLSMRITMKKELADSVEKLVKFSNVLLQEASMDETIHDDIYECAQSLSIRFPDIAQRLLLTDERLR